MMVNGCPNFSCNVNLPSNYRFKDCNNIYYLHLKYAIITLLPKCKYVKNCVHRFCNTMKYTLSTFIKSSGNIKCSKNVRQPFTTVLQQFLTGWVCCNHYVSSTFHLCHRTSLRVSVNIKNKQVLTFLNTSSAFTMHLNPTG